MIFSSACATRFPRSLPPRPDVNACNYFHELKAKRCYNMRRDYDRNGVLKKSAVPYYEPVTDLEQLDKEFMIEADPDFGNFKAWINLLKFEIEN